MVKALGCGAKRIAAELGCSRNTVRRWLQHGGWRPIASPSRSRELDGPAPWLAERFRRHAGNTDVVRQELAAEKAVVVSLRTVERAVAPLRRELGAEARATMRFETRPGGSCRSTSASPEGGLGRDPGRSALDRHGADLVHEVQPAIIKPLAVKMAIVR